MISEDDICGAIAAQIGYDRWDVLPTTTFAELRLDSIDVVQMHFDLERWLEQKLETEKLTIPDEAWEKCRAVGDIVRLVQRVAKQFAQTKGEALCFELVSPPSFC